MRKTTIVLIIILFVSILSFAQENIDMTTYYSSPYGVYNKLRLFPHAPVAADCNAAEEEGTLAYNLADHTLKVCRDDGTGSFAWEPIGFWTLNGTNLYPNALTSNIGIGIQTPGAKLDILGQVKIVDGTQGANKILTSDANGLASWQDPPTGIKPCPAGFTAVNNSYCIETNERAAGSWTAAFVSCGSLTAHLCTLGEWYAACANTAGLNGMTGNWEWVDDSSTDQLSAHITGSADCTSNSDALNANLFPFRCCFTR